MANTGATVCPLRIKVTLQWDTIFITMHQQLKTNLYHVNKGIWKFSHQTL